MMKAPPMVCYSSGVIDSLVYKLSGLKDTHPNVRLLLTDLENLQKDLVNKFGGATHWLVQVWMRQSRQLFYDIEDMIDQKLGKSNKDLAESEKDLKEQIDEFKARINEARARSERYNLLDKVPTYDANRKEDAAPSKFPFDSQLIWEKKGVLVGIDGPRKELKDHLKGRSEKKVVSILGIGGLGKTTLAKKVYEEFIGQFNCHASVTVGGISPIAALMDVLLQVNPLIVRRDLKDQEVIHQLWEFLEKKRYLVFIDDIRNEHAWRVINCALPNNERGSRILVTTRVKDVAMSCSVPPIDVTYEMKGLEVCDSRKLLDSMLPAQTEASCKTKCYDILEMCCDLPLAVIVTSGLLALKSADLGSLKKLEESSLSMPDQYSPSDGMRNVLDICFADLSPPVKTCFLYLSTFPENCTINKGRLVWRWVAEGFIPEIIDQASMWKTGEGYFNELISRRLIRPVFDDYIDDQVVACTVHPVIHDFIASLSREEDFHTTAAELISGPVPYGMIRRFSVDFSSQENNEQADIIKSSGIHLSKVRSLTVFGATGSVPNLGTFKHLRVLDLEDTKSLSNNQVGRIKLLFLLRYLGLAGTNITKLPQQIMALQLLVTLDLRRTEVRELPLFGNKKLQSLFAPLITIPSGMGEMEELEELSEVLIGPDGSHAEDVAELVRKSRWLRVLGVKFGHLAETDEVEGMKHFLEEVGKSNLQSLSLDYYSCESISSLVEFCAQKWPDNMAKFELRMSECLPQVPLEMASIQALTHLHITVEVLEASGLSTLGKLCNLIVLELSSVERAHKWLSVSNEDDGFPVLKVFWFKSSYFDGMGLKFEEGAMPFLQKLKIEFNANNTMFFDHDYDFGIHNLRGLLQVCATIHCKDARDSEVKAAEAAIRKQVVIIRCKDATDSEVVAEEAARRDQVYQIPSKQADNSTTSAVDVKISVLPDSASSHLPVAEAAIGDQVAQIPFEQADNRMAEVDNLQTCDYYVLYDETNRSFFFRMDYLSHELDNLERILDGSEKPGKLKLSVLRLVTANFSLDRKIGQGGFGSVYKGILPGSGKMVAVKKQLKTVQTEDEERMFQQEVTSLMRLKHENIVQFVGYYSHIEQEALMKSNKYYYCDFECERLLCFEFISNGSLEDYITDELRGLEWDTRFQIIMGICKGLRYLHKDEELIHMDLKPANILLSDALVPKITDFGISRLGETTKTTSKTRVCSPIYCCPEYRLDGKRSFNSDIYSLGVTIIEIVTGSRQGDPNISNVCRRWRHRWNRSAEHATLLFGLQQVTGCLELAQRCMNWKPTERPNILDIILELNKMNSSDASKSIVKHPSKKLKSIVEQQLQKKSFLDDMLGIEPLDSHFCPKRDEEIPYSIQLTNDTEDYVAFMIHENTMDSVVSATSQLPFCLLHRPREGILPPWSSCSVTIILEALKKPLHEQCVGKLCVQSTRVDEGLTPNDITEFMFKEEANKAVDVVNLTVKFSPPKQLLVVKPLELCYGPILPNKLLPCSLQLTNTTDDYVAFAIIMPQSKVLYYAASWTGIVPPCSTKGVITEILVKEEALAEMQCTDTCLVRSVVVEKDLMDHQVSVELFNEKSGVHEMELGIVFAEPSHAPSSSVYRPTHEMGPFPIETELLHIYPVELRFNCEQSSEYISLINKTNRDIIYVTAFNFMGKNMTMMKISDVHYNGVVPAYTTHTMALRTRSWKKQRYYQVRIHMITVSRRYLDCHDLDRHIGSDLSNREEVINVVRAEGGMVHEALLMGTNNDVPHPEDKETTTLYMDQHDLEDLACIDVHPTEPWFVTGHSRGTVCIWKVDPKTNATDIIRSTIDTDRTEEYHIKSVKFIAREKWVACGDDKGCVTVYRYEDNNSLTKHKTIQIGSNAVCTLAVHPSLPYLLTILSESDLIQRWDWDRDWKCTGNFVPPEQEGHYEMAEITFNPKDDKTFACTRQRESTDDSEILVFSMDSLEGRTNWRGTLAGSSIAYCSTGVLATLLSLGGDGTIELLDLSSGTRVHTLADKKLINGDELEYPFWCMACHPTRPLLATANWELGVLLWNCATYGLQKVFKLSPREWNSVGFIDVKGFQRLVVASKDKIQMLDILDGVTVFKELHQKRTPVMRSRKVKGTIPKNALAQTLGSAKKK